MKNIYKIILLVISILLPINTFAYEKEEVVFTTLNSNGEVIENIVNNHLKYTSKEEIEDYTILNNILNISGNEKLNLKDNKLTFKTNGKDITYQGTTDKELPISVNIKYYLNGEEISHKDLINKSGNVRIELLLNNNSYNDKYNMNNPFVVTSVLMLNSNNSNININNGKVVNTGTRNVAVGIATPGLYNDLDISELKDMNNIIINFDTDKYKDIDIYLVATPKVLSDTDLSIFNRLDNLSNSMNELSNGVNQLVDGSNKLVDGSLLLSEKLNEAVEGSKKISNGLDEINNNIGSISNMSTLVNTLYSKYQENTYLLNKINDGSMKTEIEEGIKNANNGLNDLLEKKALYETLNNLVNAGVELPEDKLAIYNQLSSNIDSINYGIEEYKTGINTAQEQLNNLPTSAAMLTGSNQTIEMILKSILGINSMDEASYAIEVFNNNINNLVGGINSLDEGSNSLSTGLGELSNGAKTLNEGSVLLRDGIVKLNNEGISRLTNVSNKINSYKYRVKSLVNMSKEYNGYSTNNSSDTMFIYKVK